MIEIPKEPETKKKQFGAPVKKMATVEAVVTRCGCSDEQKRSPEWHAAQKPPQPCPNPRKVEDMGVVSFWHRNPLKRLRFWLLKNVLQLKRVDFGDVK